MHASISLCFLLVVEAIGYKGQPLEPLTKFRASENLHNEWKWCFNVQYCFLEGQTHRKTMDGWIILLLSLVGCSSAGEFFEGACVQQPMFMTRKLSRSYPCGFGLGSTHCMVGVIRIAHLQ